MSPQESPLLVAEPTYGGSDHAPLNAAVLTACRMAFPGRRLVFAASEAQHEAVAALLAPEMRPEFHPIAVMTPVGRHIRRFRSQFGGMQDAVARLRPGTALILSSGPETFFAARALAAMHRRLRLAVMLHGNAGLLLERRTRDPLYRAFDYTSAFAATRHPRIATVVLEAHIAAVIAEAFPRRPPSLVWPHPVAPNEVVAESAPLGGPDGALRIGFVGAAARAKGFDRFLEAAREPRCGAIAFRLAGYLTPDFPPAEVPLPELATAPLPREAFLRAIRALDYAFLPFDAGVYRFTASGSLLDCIANLVPVIATPSTLLAQLVRDYGPIGHVCDTPAEALALLRDPERLRRPQDLATFRANLARIREDRLPAALAARLRRDLAASA